MVKKISYSFKKGWSQVPQGRAKEIKKEIMDAFLITTRPSWTKRLKGEIVPTAPQYFAIENIFKSLGITEIWGE